MACTDAWLSAVLCKSQRDCGYCVQINIYQNIRIVFVWQKLSIFMKMATLTSPATSAPVQMNRKLPRVKCNAFDTRIYLIAFLLAINIYNDHIGITTMLCNAGPLPTSLVLPPSSSSVDSPTTIRVVNLTRQHGGDIFTAFGKCTLYFSSSFFPTYFHWI